MTAAIVHVSTLSAIGVTHAHVNVQACEMANLVIGSSRIEVRKAQNPIASKETPPCGGPPPGYIAGLQAKHHQSWAAKQKEWNDAWAVQQMEQMKAQQEARPEPSTPGCRRCLWPVRQRDFWLLLRHVVRSLCAHTICTGQA